MLLRNEAAQATDIDLLTVILGNRTFASAFRSSCCVASL